MAAARQSSKKKEKLPFYQATGDKTSASIIAEARKDLKSVSTKRPNTPGDAGRHLFGSHQHSTQQGTVKRPPSVYSLGRRHFNEGDLSRPPTGGQQLPTLDLTRSTEHLQGALALTPPTPTSSMVISVPHSPSRTVAQQSSAGEMTGLPPTPKKEGKRRATGDSGTDLNSGVARTVSADSKPKTTAPPSTEPRPPMPSDVQRHHSAGSVMERGMEHSASCSTGHSPKRTVTSPKGKAVAYWNTHIAPLLLELSPATQDTQRLCLLLDQLWEGLCVGNFLGRSGGVGGSKRRGTVLKAVFRLLDSKDPKLLLKVAKILFGMKVTGSNLQNACKLVFTLSKDEHNDPHFAKEGIASPLLEVLESLDPSAQPDAMVYCMGAVKLLCSNSDLRTELVACGAVKTIAGHLRKLSEPTLSTADSSSSILIQLVGALRNLSDNVSLREEFITHGVIAGLCGLLGRYSHDGDLMFVVSRLFSKLTLHSDCCTAVGSCRDDLPALCSLLTLHKDKPDLVVRVCFALGNLTTSAAGDSLRQLLASPPCSLLHVLTEVGGWYLEACPNGQGRSKHEDVLVKLQRVMANLAIDAEIGQQAALNRECTELLIKIVERHSSWESEEVLLNALAAVNNLTYYATGDGLWSQQAERLGEVFLDLLLGESKELRKDCLRVFGNLSRSQQVCHAIMEQRVGDVLVALLDSEDREQVYSACGVLLNVMIVPELRPLLANTNGVRKLVDALRDFGYLDWQFSALVCKTLWNYSDKMTSSLSCFGAEETELLIEQLEVYLDEELAVESVPEGVPEETRAFLHDMWRSEFCTVAKPLLERVKTNCSDLIPL